MTVSIITLLINIGLCIFIRYRVRVLLQLATTLYHVVWVMQFISYLLHKVGRYHYFHLGACFLEILQMAISLGMVCLKNLMGRAVVLEGTKCHFILLLLEAIDFTQLLDV